MRRGGLTGKRCLALVRIVLLIAMLTACGGGDSPGECTEGQSIACTCTNGLSGAQTCGADGTYGPCSCDGAIDAATVDEDAAQSGDGEIFVVNRGDTSIRVYDRMASGDAAPLRMIRGGNTQLSGPIAIAVDATNGEIYVANGANDSITVYAIDADGNVPPTRRIAGAATGLAIADSNAGCSGGPFGGLQVEVATDELVVPCSDPDTTGCLMTFARAADGNVAPLRNITGPATLLPASSSPGELIRAIHVDLTTDEIFTLTEDLTFVAFNRTDTGDVAPVRSNRGGTGCFHDLVTDPEAGELWINTPNSFYVFARAADGKMQPLRTITHTQDTTSMFLDPARGEAILLSTDRIDTVDVTTGAVIRTVEGAATGLELANDVAVVP